MTKGSESGLNITRVNENNNNVIQTSNSVSQNHPNPFNRATSISCGVPKGADVKLIVYDAHGHVLAGEHQVKLDAANLNSGVYFYRLEAGNFTSTKKFILSK